MADVPVGQKAGDKPFYFAGCFSNGDFFSVAGLCSTLASRLPRETFYRSVDLSRRKPVSNASHKNVASPVSTDTSG